MFRRILLSGSTLVFGLLLCVPASAQEHYLNQLYGQGVHAFHRGDFSEASRLLSDAIDSGSKDPRAYYFRAFAKAKTGGGLDQTDIQNGARLELDGYNGYDIGLSLQRVQGTQRLQFEKMRRDASLAIQRAAKSMRSQPSYGSGVIGGEILRPSIAPTREGGPMDLPPAAPTDETDPFDGGGDTDPAAGDPFEDDLPEPADDAPEEMTPEAEDDNLFGDEPGTDAAPAEAEDDGLFGDDSGGDGLFGDEAPADAAPTDAAPADDGGLFGPEDAGGDAPAPADDDLDDLFG